MGFGVNQLDQMQQPPQPGKDSGNGVGMQGAITNTATSAQPSIGAPNQYSQTVGLMDNQQQQNQFLNQFSGFGKR